MWELKKISDEEYFSLGELNIKHPKKLVVNASLLKDIFNRGLFEVLIEPTEHSETTLKNFKTGSALHKYILENSTFDKEYHFGAYNPAKDTTELNAKDEEFLKAIRKECELKFPELIDEKGAEVTVTGEIDEIKVKAKLDKFIISGNRAYIYDLKSTSLPLAKIKKTPQGKAWEIARQISDYHYDLQMYFYSLLVEEWLKTQNLFLEVIPILVFASKQDYKVKQFMLSPETLAKGEEKFNQAFSRVREFATHGAKAVDKFEVV